MNLRALTSASLLLTLSLGASEATAAPTVMLETDPATFAFGGFSAHARLAPERSHLAVGVGAYAMTFPSVLAGMAPANHDEGWKVRLSLGVGAFGDYFFAEEPRGWFVGAQLAVQRYRYENEHVAGAEAGATNLLVMPRVGYLYRPFRAGFFVEPWLGVGATARLAGSAQVGDREYALFPVVPYAAVHVGWQL